MAKFVTNLGLMSQKCFNIYVAISFFNYCEELVLRSIGLAVHRGCKGFALYPPARHHLRCLGSSGSRCIDNIASRSSIASPRDARDASIASRSSRHRSAIFDLRSHRDASIAP